MTNKTFSAWKNLPKNLTQNYKFKKEVTGKALAEANDIADKRVQNKDYVGTTKIPWITTWSQDSSLLTKEQKKKILLRRAIRKQVAETRLNQAKERDIIK